MRSPARSVRRAAAAIVVALLAVGCTPTEPPSGDLPSTAPSAPAVDRVPLPASWSPKTPPGTYAVGYYAGSVTLSSTPFVSLSWRFDTAHPDQRSELLQAARDRAEEHGSTVTEQRWANGFGITVDDPGTYRFSDLSRTHVVVNGALTWVLTASRENREEGVAVIDRLVQLATPRVGQLSGEWPGSVLTPGLPVELHGAFSREPAIINTYIVDLRWNGGGASSRVELRHDLNGLSQTQHENNIEHARQDGLRMESIQIAASTEAVCGQPLTGPFSQGFAFTKGDPARPAALGIVAVGRTWNVRFATTVPAGADRRSAPWQAALAAPSDICNTWHWLPTA
ncbi:hypothetical protein F4553_000194 [Allocatelliglobosispora scoriae]|uniref:DUF3558 domain-containing protein n=1 Tax=Allocatelliglobosispora scoriae TaxID=643052 RepID=A0A841BGQ4_9ACTN|nr:hypothetical protein [Allocatelliglobosispora scoriae]MBB5866815.1 hypothetical protein [Allocatelliglobosispora scoriae]